MKTDIAQYVNSGILEAYITGAVSPDEEREILILKQKYPEVRQALYQLEVDMEAMAALMAITPPPGTWDKIAAEIDGIIAREQTASTRFIGKEKKKGRPANEQQFIEVEARNSYMRIHKAWKWFFATVFVLGKIFLATAIYFYLENRQAQEQIQELKTEIKGLK